MKQSMDLHLLISAAQALRDARQNVLAQSVDEAYRTLMKTQTDTHPEFWVVLDENKVPVYSAGYRQACHDHINDVLMRDEFMDVHEAAGKWVVRRAILMEDA